MRRVSLRFRLAATGAGAGAILAALAAVGLGELFKSHLERRAMAEMAVHLDQVVAGLDRDANGRLLSTGPLSGIYWQADVGARLIRSRSLWDYVLPLPEDALTTGKLHTHHLLGPRGATLLAL